VQAPRRGGRRGFADHVKVHPVGMQDRDGAPDVISSLPALAQTFADGSCSGPKPRARLRHAGLSEDPVEVAKKPRDENGFAVLLRRRVVERTFARKGRRRRLAKDRAASRRELLGVAPARSLPVSASPGLRDRRDPGMNGRKMAVGPDSEGPTVGRSAA